MLLIVCEFYFFFYCNTIRYLQPHYRLSTDSLQTLYSLLQTLYKLSTAYYRLSTDSLQPTMTLYRLSTAYYGLSTALLWLSTASLQPLQTLYRLSTATLQQCCSNAAAVLCRT
jgi:hypothetical protein